MTPYPLIRKLCDRAPVITDGAWGTQLQARGLAPGEVPDLWNLTHPKEVAAVARAYVEAGSQIILTNTFGANRIRLAESGSAERLKEINKAGVALSREAAGKDALVFASLGPSGKLLMNGDITEDELLVAFTEQAEALAGGEPDGLVVETMSDLAEAKLAIAAAKATGLPVVASMVFDSGKDKDRTMMGTTPEQAAAALVKAGADAISLVCPFCSVMLDDNQKAIAQAHGLDIKIPVLYFPQVLGMAMGISWKELGMNMNRVSVKDFVARVEEKRAC